MIDAIVKTGSVVIDNSPEAFREPIGTEFEIYAGIFGMQKPQPNACDASGFV